MISIRRMIGSLLAGGLALALAAGTASAAADLGLTTALAGFDMGVAAADAQLADAANGTYENEGITKALAAIDDLVKAKMAEGANGNGPVQAKAVLDALLKGDSPSELAPGQTESPFGKIYGQMKAEQAKLKAEKPEKPEKPDKPDKPDTPANP